MYPYKLSQRSLHLINSTKATNCKPKLAACIEKTIQAEPAKNSLCLAIHSRLSLLGFTASHRTTLNVMSFRRISRRLMSLVALQLIASSVWWCHQLSRQWKPPGLQMKYIKTLLPVRQTNIRYIIMLWYVEYCSAAFCMPGTQSRILGVLGCVSECPWTKVPERVTSFEPKLEQIFRHT